MLSSHEYTRELRLSTYFLNFSVINEVNISGYSGDKTGLLERTTLTAYYVSQTFEDYYLVQFNVQCVLLVL